jgi:hypothetical protein
MTKAIPTNAKTKANTAAASKTTPTKQQQVINLLTRDGGVTLEAMSTTVGWQPHSTGAFMTGLKKKGHVLESEKIEGVRYYRMTTMPSA